MTIMRQLRLKYQVSSPCSPVIMDLFCNFNIVALNIMGPWVRLQDVMFGTVNLHHPSMFLVFETHGLVSKVETFWNNLGFNPLFIQEAVGHSSGIWVLSSVIDITCSLLYSMSQTITFSINNRTVTWYCTTIYGSPAASI